jgi:hypothetical protein
MADTVEMQDIRGLDIDRTAKGFAEEAYIFKNDCQTTTMNGDSVRWYQKTAGTLSATSPSATAKVSPLSRPMTLEVSWTRNTSYSKKYFVEGFISMEDIKTADLDVLATTVRDLTRVIVRDVDSAIFSVMSEGWVAAAAVPTTIQTFSAAAIGGGEWNKASYGADIVKDLMHAKKMIWAYSYNPEGASLYLSPQDYESMVTWLISGKGSSIPSFASEKIASGTVMQILGLNVKVSNNVCKSGALVIVPQVATTWRQADPTTARTVEEAGIGTRVRVWESGVAYNTDPKAIVLITNTQTTGS